jgi:hypothetical protein
MNPKAFHARRDDLIPEHLGNYETRKTQFGLFTATFEHVPAGFPPGGPALYAGLPDNACQVPHWGYVFKGRIKFTYVDGIEQVVEAGEAYYVAPGHRWDCLEDAETIEFSPTDELDRHMEAVARNLERLGTAEVRT